MVITFVSRNKKCQMERAFFLVHFWKGEGVMEKYALENVDGSIIFCPRY